MAPESSNRNLITKYAAKARKKDLAKGIKINRLVVQLNSTKNN